MPITRNLGDSVQLLCSDNSPCQGISYAFHHYNLHTGQFEPVHQGSHRLTININTLDNAGEYSCVKECANSEFNCYWNVIGKPYIVIIPISSPHLLAIAVCSQCILLW